MKIPIMMRLFSARPNPYTVPAQFATKRKGPKPQLSAQAWYQSWWGFSVLGPIDIQYLHNLKLKVKVQYHHCQPKPSPEWPNLSLFHFSKRLICIQSDRIIPYQKANPIDPISYPIHCVMLNQSQTWNIHTQFFYMLFLYHLTSELVVLSSASFNF